MYYYCQYFPLAKAMPILEWLGLENKRTVFGDIWRKLQIILSYYLYSDENKLKNLYGFV